MQLSDRFHLIKNLIDAIKDDLKKLGEKHINLGEEKYDLSWLNIEPPSAEKSKFKRKEKKQELIEKIRYDYNINHMSKMELVEKYKLELKTINRYLIKDSTIPRRNKKTELCKYAKVIYDKLKEQYSNNQTINYHEIYTIITKLGYRSTYGNFYKQLRLRIISNDLCSSSTITRKEFNKLLYGKPLSVLKLSESDHKKAENYFKSDNVFSKALKMITTFSEIIKNNSTTTTLEAYIKTYQTEEYLKWICVRSFIDGVNRDIEAVKNQITEKITNSTTEGFVSKVKAIKKRTYGRASFAYLKSLILLANTQQSE